MGCIRCGRLALAGAGKSAAGTLLALCAAALLLAACTPPPSGSASHATGRPGAGATDVGAPTGRPQLSAVGGAEAGTAVQWTVYHYDAAGSGDVTARIDLAHLRAAWTSAPLDGQLYGEPLVLGATVYVATEDDSVYALSASSGRLLWRSHLGTPVPAAALPCGDISPVVGITSTPVLDPARHELFTVADELVGGAPRHVLYGLRLADGGTELAQGVDPPGADTAALLQRTSLTLDGSRVVFGYGGNYGDCSRYHGWLESVPVTGGSPRYFEVDSRRGDYQGAIWMGGAAPVVTRTGDIYVAAGNGSVKSPSARYDGSDSVLELSPTLRLIDYFAPSDWYADNRADRDLGSAAPAVLPNGLVLQGGKPETIYLLRSSLGGIGHQLSELTGVCGATFDGGVAFSGATAYLPCENGVLAVATSARRQNMSIRWQAPSGAGGPPIIVGGLVWSIGDGTLFALSPRSGQVLERLRLGSSATHFPTPSFGDGRLFATSADQVHAFVEG